MKKFEAPILEVETFAVEDILTTSSGGSSNCGSETDEF